MFLPSEKKTCLFTKMTSVSMHDWVYIKSYIGRCLCDNGKPNILPCLIFNWRTPFASITWHQKEPLGCVVYSHCPTNDSYNKCKHCCCLPCSYVTKPFGTLQRVIKSERVCVSFGHSKSWYLFSQKRLWLNLQTYF